MAFLRDWLCRGCGHKTVDVPTGVMEQRCPSCGKMMERIYEPPLVMFNGGGWTPKFHGENKEK